MPRSVQRLPHLGLLLSLTLWLVPAGAASAPPAPRQLLEDFFSGLTALRAEFQQTVRDARGRIVQESRGIFFLQRPDRFRWDYREPYRQVVVGDGRRLWLYDEDLEQVTVRDFASLGPTPAALLSSTEPLERRFHIRPAADRENGWDESSLVLEPWESGTGFARIRLAFGRDGTLQRMELEDDFGQVTTLRFARLERNPELDPALFHFQPPAGVDIIYDSADPPAP